MANVKWIDATIWVPEEGWNEDEWRRKFEQAFERYAYGREIAPTTGRRHLQFRGVLKSALDSDTLGALSLLGFRDITPTHVRNFDYVVKEGDFFLSWDINRPEYDLVRSDPATWMVQLEAMENDFRTIEIVVDERGNSGKTAWAMYMANQHKACYIPPVRRGIDMSAVVIAKFESPWYIIDTPRAFEFTDDWACAVEQLKNGYVFDTRNTYKERILTQRPRVTLLCNSLPDYERYFSKDRVLPFRITPEGYLWSV